jgi:hypothetical protein
MTKNFNLVLPTIYIGGLEPFINKFNMELVEHINMSDIHPNLNMKIKSNGIDIETNFKVKKNNTKNQKHKKKRNISNIDIDINNNKSINSNKIIKKSTLSLKEKRKRNKIAADKYRDKQKLKYQETMNLVSKLTKELKEAHFKIKKLEKQIVSSFQENIEVLF